MRRTQFKLLPPVVLRELAITSSFLTLWLLPVIMSWFVAAGGYFFSYVGTDWQSQNIDQVGYGIFIAFIAGMISSKIVVMLTEKINWSNSWGVNLWPVRFSNIQLGAIVLILILAGYGVFKSFGGTILQKTYSGPAVSWLGYGAWSVTFLLALGAAYYPLRRRNFCILRNITVLCIAFAPFLFCGSRIDFLSSMLALAAYVLFAPFCEGIAYRRLKALGILIFATLVAFYVNSIRYDVHDEWGGKSRLIPFHKSKSMVYLSTFGDIGASVFQAAGLHKSQETPELTTKAALKNYAQRLLPGPLFPNRPGDIWASVQEDIGGGAMHALGEGMLYAGLVGCALVGTIFGCLIGCSIAASRSTQTAGNVVSWLIFLLPWLILIRAGWYQLFTLPKTLQVLFVFVVLLSILGWTKHPASDGLIENTEC